MNKVHKKEKDEFLSLSKHFSENAPFSSTLNKQTWHKKKKNPRKHLQNGLLSNTRKEKKLFWICFIFFHLLKKKTKYR